MNLILSMRKASNSLRANFIVISRSSIKHRCAFSTSASRTNSVPTSTSTITSRILDSIRDPSSFHTALLLSSSSRTPLITLWKTSYSRSSAAVIPIIRSVLDSASFTKGQKCLVTYAEVEVDSPDIGDLASRYLISSVPTLLAFDRQEAQMDSKVTEVELLKDTKFLVEWIQKEIVRGGSGGGGGDTRGVLGSIFGGRSGK